MSDTDPASSGPAQQEIWRKRLAEAEVAFREAAVALHTLQQEGGSSSEVEAARERKTHARLEYLRVLRVFTDIVLRGKLPG